ncbi:vitamin K epoxide reductase family protein [Nocardia huaxiensis]|uniref:Vitamin K epoxide reductase family protein n=1 Tax=Nocardia huaxiensis TaxID=2755382 RepID=A0A7D6VDW8_9NOCA|nr:vitamin K epoxide reductase family protein [Nocardia huaxiensis]QLY32222.1 vitamin K epoxide reductase family protein [Nocardia huaxiensis]UFS94075.1 vitamin K epoxide reductase family protein [Nocardia huaxiensis]
MISAPPRSAWPVLLLGLLGWGASVTLLVEKFKSLTDSGYKPLCSIDSVVSCTTVMDSSEAAFFGFPNPIIGVVGFSVVVTLGVLAVVGIGFPRWVWGGLWFGLLLGTVAVCWLIYHAVFTIHALCPWCMVVWAVVPPLLALVTGLLWGRSRGFVQVVVEWRWTMVAVYYAVVILIVYIQFQDYWSSKL